MGRIMLPMKASAPVDSLDSSMLAVAATVSNDDQCRRNKYSVHHSIPRGY